MGKKRNEAGQEHALTKCVDFAGNVGFICWFVVQIQSTRDSSVDGNYSLASLCANCRNELLLVQNRLEAVRG